MLESSFCEVGAGLKQTAYVVPVSVREQYLCDVVRLHTHGLQLVQQRATRVVEKGHIALTGVNKDFGFAALQVKHIGAKRDLQKPARCYFLA